MIVSFIILGDQPCLLSDRDFSKEKNKTVDMPTLSLALMMN